jgi:hypothetical protein
VKLHPAANNRLWPIQLKNSIAVARLSNVEKPTALATNRSVDQTETPDRMSALGH